MQIRTPDEIAGAIQAEYDSLFVEWSEAVNAAKRVEHAGRSDVLAALESDYFTARDAYVDLAVDPGLAFRLAAATGWTSAEFPAKPNL